MTGLEIEHGMFLLGHFFAFAHHAYTVTSVMLAFDIQLHCAYGDEFDIKLDINIKVDAHSDARDP